MVTLTASFSLTMELTAFVIGNIPPPPARVLEIGCGAGELARALAAARYNVTAVDPDAPEGAIFERMPFEELPERGRFDAVVASRSLHHIADLGAAVDKIARLLDPRGVLVLDEFAWDRLDEATAAWLYERGRSGEVDRWRDDWREEHEGLHGYEAMRRELDRRFDERFLAWVPYLYRYEETDITPVEEQILIEAGRIRPIGFRYVGAALQ
jgi:SAM-dependent methyltransferase